MQDLQPLFHAVLSEAGSYAAGKIIDKIIESVKKDDFAGVVKKVALSVDNHYNGELFGGNLREVLLGADARELLKRFLNPFDQPTEDDFKTLDNFHFDSLPPDFIATLQKTLLEELLNDRNFQVQMQNVVHMLQTDATFSRVEVIGLRQEAIAIDAGEKLERILARLDASLQVPQQLLPVVTTVQYSSPEEYIPRSLFPLSAASDPYAKPKGALKELIKTETRIILCSAAGIGKSTEVAQLASQLPKEDNVTIPILCRINTYTGSEIETLLSKEMKGWETISSHRLLIIFDGLDEMHDTHFPTFISKIIVFQGQAKQARVIITCRDNFLSPMFLSETQTTFSVYKLKELSQWDVITHARKKFGYERAERFLEKTRLLGITEIMRSPFFMSYLFKAEERNETLPASKREIFERLILHRIECDKERFALKGIRIDRHTVYIRKQVTRLALIMVTAGRNYITDTEFQELVPVFENGRELLEHTLLFNKETKDHWQFDHNNFKEYLAAKALSTKSFEEIKGIVSLTPSFTTIKPTWVNTLSFVFILVEHDSQTFKDLLKLLIASDAELLLRFERDRIGLRQREEIFKEILHSYRSKGIVARSQNFDVTDLADFVFDSTAILEWLKGDLQPGSSVLVVGEASRMLPRFKFIEAFRADFEARLENIITWPDSSDETKYYAVSCLASLNWRTRESFVKLLPFLLQDSQYGRAAIFQYLSTSGFQDDFIDTIISTSRNTKRLEIHINHTPSRKDVRLGDESILREQCLLSVSSPGAIAKILDYFIEESKEYSSDSLASRTLQNGLLDKVITLVQEGNSALLSLVLALFTSKANYRHRNELENFVIFFRETGSRKQAIDDIMALAKVDRMVYSALATLIEVDDIDLIIQEFRQGRLSENDVFAIRGNLNWANRPDIHDLFYSRINEVSGNKFLYLDHNINWAQVRKARLERDLDLLCSQQLFLNAVQEIFDVSGTTMLNEDDLWDFNKKHFSDENFFDNNIALESLRLDFSLPVTLSQVSNKLQPVVNWEWFRMHKLIKFHSQNLNTLSEREIALIKSWCDSELKHCIFPTAITNSKCRWLEIYFAYWTMAFDFDYPVDVYLEFFWLDSRSMIYKMPQDREPAINISDWVSSKVGLASARQKIRQNLKAGFLSSSVLFHHIQWCGRHGLNECLPEIRDALLDNKIEKFSLVESCQIYLELGGELAVAEQILQTRFLDQHDKFNLIDLLLKRSSTVAFEFLESEIIKSSDDSTKLQCAKHLMNYGKLTGLLYYKEWVRTHNTFDDFIGSRQYTNIKMEEALPVLIELVDIYFSEDFDRDHLHMQDQDLFEALCSIGASSENQYNTVRTAFDRYTSLSEGKMLHYYISRLDTLHVTKKTQSLSIIEVARQVDSVLN